MIRRAASAGPLIACSTIADRALINSTHRGGTEPARWAGWRAGRRGPMMRTRYLIAGLLTISLVGCAGAATPAPTPEPTPQPTVAPSTPEPVASPSPSPTALGVTVTFDGTDCNYIGPSIIPDGTVLRFQYVPDQEQGASYLDVYGVRPGTTPEDFGPNGVGSVYEPPDWVFRSTVAWVHGTGAMLYTIESVKQGKDGVDYTVGGYHVACSTPEMYLAAQLSVAGA